ncbi:MAG: spore germination protein [Firmicutes bacterium HGW-Firmicutes-7]|nr:MAG: spore germination protein [Firmicutes bacterium HGW-Firmicutes-7]
MPSLIYKLFKKWIPKGSTEDKKDPLPILSSIDINIDKIKVLFDNTYDLTFRNFMIGGELNLKAALFFINGLTDKISVENHILDPLTHQNYFDVYGNDYELFFKDLKSSILTLLDIRDCFDLNDAIDGILLGKTVLLIDKMPYAIIIDNRKWKNRAIEQPFTEVVIKGSHEGFNETLVTSTSLIRRRLKTPLLTFEQLNIGTLTGTEVVIAYIRGIANEKVLDEIKSRLSRIHVDGILDSGYIEQYIEDAPLSIFPTIGNTEKPDVVVSKLLDGRFAIIVDGSPTVLTMPYLFVEALQTSEDYYMSPIIASFLRITRIVSLFFVVYLPGLYIAIASYHHDIIPTHLMLTMAASVEGVPFSPFIEVLMMSTLFIVLKEAGIRMPRAIGQAVSIVGALILGQAAVEAGFVSNPVVMITALAGIGGFVIYPLNSATTLLWFVFAMLGSVAGFFGILYGTIFLLVHLVSLRSFGSPYFSPLAPRSTEEFVKDVIFRAPLWTLNTGPKAINWKKVTHGNVDKLKYKK